MGFSEGKALGRKTTRLCEHCGPDARRFRGKEAGGWARPEGEGEGGGRWQE